MDTRDRIGARQDIERRQRCGNAILTREGAIIVDPIVIPSVGDPDPANNYLTFPICARTESAPSS